MNPDNIQEYTGRLYNSRKTYIMGSRPRIYLTYFNFLSNNPDNIHPFLLTNNEITVERRRNYKTDTPEEYDNITFRGYFTIERNIPMIVMVE
jgi:hypothetical protein